MATSGQLTPCPVPGSIGWVGFGDKTFEFAYSPIEFVKKRVREHRSPVFKVRVLNKPTIFLTSNNAVKELLQGIKTSISHIVLYHKFYSCTVS